MKNITIFRLKVIIFTAGKYHSILHGHVRVMRTIGVGQFIREVLCSTTHEDAFQHRGKLSAKRFAELYFDWPKSGPCKRSWKFKIRFTPYSNGWPIR